MKSLLTLIIYLSSSFVFANDKNIDIALIFNYDDKFNSTASFLDKGFQLASDEAKKSGIEVKFQRYSYKESTESVLSAAKKAISDGYDLIIGGENSDEALAIAKLIENKNIALITPTATNPSVTVGRSNVFRTCFSDDIVAEKMAELVFKRFRSKRIGVIHNVSYPYTDYLAKKFINRINELNDEMVSSEKKTKIYVQKIIRNQKDFSKEVAYFKSKNVEHQVMLTFQSDLLRFYSMAVKESFFPIYFGSDGWGSNESIFKRMAKENIQRSKFQAYRILYWREESKKSKNIEFKKLFKSKFKEEANAWSAIGYDTVNIILDSMKEKNNGLKFDVDTLRNFTSKELITTDNFSFNQNNTPKKDIFIYKIDSSGVHYYATEN